MVRLHSAAMGHSLWAQLGPKFLEGIYEALLLTDPFIGFVFVDQGRVRGFIAGTADGQAMMRDVLARSAPRLAYGTLGGLVRRPTAAWPLLETFRYHAKTRQTGEQAITAESMFCSFEPSLRGRRISGLINKVLFDELAARGHRHVKITTEEDNQAAVRQLTSWGFERIGRFRFYGKEMLVWRLDLLACERVGPPTC